MSRIFFTMPATPTRSIQDASSMWSRKDMVRTKGINFTRFNALETCGVIVEVVRGTGQGGPNRAVL